MFRTVCILSVTAAFVHPIQTRLGHHIATRSFSRMQEIKHSRRTSSRLLQRNNKDQHDEMRYSNSERGHKKQQETKTVSRRKRKSESSQGDEPSLDIQEPVRKLKHAVPESSQTSNKNDSKKGTETTTEQQRYVTKKFEVNHSTSSEPLKHANALPKDEQTVSDYDLLTKYNNRLVELKKFNIVNPVPVFKKLFTNFEKMRNDSKGAGMSKYMRNKFVYFGIASPERRAICAEFWDDVKALSPSDLRTLAYQTWNSPEREFHYFTSELLQKEIFRIYDDEDLTTLALALKTLDFVKSFIEHPSSWWDTVDGLSPNVVGPLVQKYPNELLPEMDKWNQSSCFWVCRASIIYQLSYKKETDAERLFRYCLQAADEKEFFIRKAIGWALRQYYRTDPRAVREFVLKNKNKLSPLSVKEALKHDKQHK